MKTYFETIKDKLCSIENDFTVFFENILITEFNNDRHSTVVILTNPYHYNTNLSAVQKKQQIALLDKFNNWEEHFNLLTLNMPDDISKEIEEEKCFLKDQINLKSNWGTESNTEKNLSKIKRSIQKLSSIIELLTKDDSIVLIPDTNSLIIDPDFNSYKKILGDSINIIISPTVLSELDKLKMTHRDRDFKNKVDSVIKRIKGLRTQGSLIQGVTVNKTITIKMAAKEPNFTNTLSWLDPDNDDDRIIAFTLEYLRANLTQNVVIVTADINLQNKAEMANLPYSEPPSKL